MKAEYIQEPYLFFGKGKSLCPREGIAGLNVYDTVQEARKNQLLIGLSGLRRMLSCLKTGLKDLRVIFLLAQRESKRDFLNLSLASIKTKAFVPNSFTAQIMNEFYLQMILKEFLVRKIVKRKFWMP